MNLNNEFNNHVNDYNKKVESIMNNYEVTESEYNDYLTKHEKENLNRIDDYISLLSMNCVDDQTVWDTLVAFTSYALTTIEMIMSKVSGRKITTLDSKMINIDLIEYINDNVSRFGHHDIYTTFTESNQSEHAEIFSNIKDIICDYWTPVEEFQNSITVDTSRMMDEICDEIEITIGFKDFVRRLEFSNDNHRTQIGLLILNAIYKIFSSKLSTTFELFYYDNMYSFELMFNEIFDNVSALHKSLPECMNDIKTYIAAISILFDEDQKNQFIYLIDSREKSTKLTYLLESMVNLSKEYAKIEGVKLCLA